MIELAKNALVVVAHPDDEVLGAGGAIAKLTSRKAQVHVVFATRGKGGRFEDGGGAAAQVSQEQNKLAGETMKAKEILGISTVHYLDLPDNRMDTIPMMDISHALTNIANKIQPDLVLTHHHSDYNWDHTIIFDACMMAFRASPGDPTPQMMATFEVLSSTERAAPNPKNMFCPNIYIDIASTIEIKQKALQAYASELHSFPHPRSTDGIRILAQKRGMEVGLAFAECYELIRAIGRD